MSESEELRGEALYNALMALKPADLSEGQWAIKAGKSRGYLSELKQKGSRPRIDTLQNIMGVIGKTVADLEPDRMPAPAVEAREVPKRFTPLDLERDIPVYGTAQGAMLRVRYDGQAAEIEQTVLELEAIDYKRRPPALAQNRRVYALYITGESMRPRYREGDLVYVDSRRPPDIGDDVIVQLVGEKTEDFDGEVQHVLVKTLVRRTADFYELEQYRPETVFRIPKAKVQAIHRVIPLSELMA